MDTPTVPQVTPFPIAYASGKESEEKEELDSTDPRDFERRCLRMHERYRQEGLKVRNGKREFG